MGFGLTNNVSRRNLGQEIDVSKLLHVNTPLQA